MRFQLTLEVAQSLPQTFEAESTDDLRLALTAACERAAPGWLASITESAPFFHYDREDKTPWSGLPKELRQIRKSVPVVCCLPMPGPDGRFVHLVLNIGWLMQVEATKPDLSKGFVDPDSGCWSEYPTSDACIPLDS